MDTQIAFGILFIVVAFLLLIILRAKMSPPPDYSDATRSIVEREDDDVMRSQYRELIAKQDADFRAGR